MNNRFRDWGLFVLVLGVLIIASAIQHKTALWFMRASAPSFVHEAEADPARGQLPPLPAGRSYVSTLPGECESATVSGIAYQRCGTRYYRAYLKGAATVYVIEKP